MLRIYNSLPEFWRRGKGVVGGLLLAAALTAACGRLGQVPPALAPDDYQEVSLAQLRNPAAAQALVGRRVRFPAFFWEYVTYDPAMCSNYALLARHPRGWWDLRWAALYESPRMQGFYDRLALDAAQQTRFRPRRLTRLLIYGEVLPLGPRLTYVRLHQAQELEPN
jgi:hypothetical protein